MICVNDMNIIDREKNKTPQTHLFFPAWVKDEVIEFPSSNKEEPKCLGKSMTEA